MKVSANRLQADGSAFAVRYVASPNHGARLTPKYLIIHFTAGRSGQSSVDWFKNPAAKASAHVVIDRGTGDVTQMVDFDVVAWHAGKSKWKNVVGLNQASIGIELDNAGGLTLSGGKYLSWFKGEYQPADVYISAAPGRPTTYWHEYSDKQIDSLVEVASALHATYKFADILGHSDIAPGRKTDPGPAFPMSSFKSKILGRT